ncbi:hypothetical protein [Kribbella sp. NPDC050459]|uniref:hypothetical protein n=1 Tax=Kribbella sp. NPDC050459 TaxID=3155785 RepID=UPI0033F43135
MAWSGLELGPQLPGVEPFQEPVEQAEVHLADQVGVVLGERLEGAVARHDRVALDARLEALLFEDAHHGVGVSFRAGGTRGTGGEFVAE